MQFHLMALTGMDKNKCMATENNRIDISRHSIVITPNYYSIKYQIEYKGKLKLYCPKLKLLK